MYKPSISSYLRERLDDIIHKKEPGPYITISRLYGCDGLELANLLVQKLNERDEQQRWKLYYKDLLKQLAEDTGLTEEIIEKERFARPSLMKDFLRGLMQQNIPNGFEIRKNITTMIRTVAFEGHAIILGQGATAATGDLENGISVRIEAPKEWRIARVCVREQLSKDAATARIDQIDAQRQYLREIYEKQNPRHPAFNLLLDNAVFNKEQMVDILLFILEQKGTIKKLP
jgi:cytidylate kinase